MNPLEQPLKEISDLWNDWRRKSGEPISLPKIAAAIAAIYAYQRITPNTNWDKPAIATAAIGAVLAATVPRRDELEQQRMNFAVQLLRSLLSLPQSEDTFHWLEQLSQVEQIALSQLFNGEPIEEVAKFIAKKENRDSVEHALRMMRNNMETAGAQQLQSHSDEKPTIDKAARLIPKGFGGLLDLLGGGGIACAVKTPYFEIESNQGKFKIPTNIIRHVGISPYKFGSTILTIDQSTFKGDLLTTHVQIEGAHGVQMESQTIACSKVSAITAIAPVTKLIDDALAGKR